MERLYDEFSMSLAASVPRRESLRRMGAVIAGLVLNPWGLGTAWAGPDPCRAFCRCSNKTQQNQCLSACRACNSETSRLCGSCGAYACCSTGTTCCSGYCTDLANDFENCGGCGAACDNPGPYEDGACILGECVYLCVEGAIDCNGICTPVNSDPDNCGACGNVCPAATPFCTDGICTETYCNGADLLFDALNCGACGYSCQPLEHCSWGVCEGSGGGDYGY